MNKEELLKQLTELQTRLDSEVDSYNIENRVEEIENISAKIERNNTIIKYYSEILADDKNFVDETPLQYYLMLEAQELENLRSKQGAERENQSRILSEESIIASFIATISAGQEETAKLGVDNIQLSIDIRRARLSANTAKIEACESKISSNNVRIQEIQDKIGSIQTDIEQHMSVIESLNQLSDGLKEQTAEAQAKYNDVVAQEALSKKGEVDLAKKNKSEAELETLKTVTSTLEQRSTAISYDFAGEIRNLITDYNNSIITDEEMKLKLSELKEKLPEDFLKSDEATRNLEISENQRAQEILEVKVAELSRKLSNGDNYKVTPAEYARTRAKLSTCKMNMSSYDSQIAMLNAQIPTNELDLIEYKEIINVCNEENEEIARQLILNNGVDKELEAELTSKQKMNFTIIAESNELIENINTDGLENTQVLAQLEERKARTEKLIASYQAELADENALDKSQMRLDQIELANSQQGLNALKNREQFLSNSLVIVMDRIIGGDLDKENEVVVDNTTVNPIPFADFDGVNPDDMSFDNAQEISPIPVGKATPENTDGFADFNPEGYGLDDEDLNLFGIENPLTKTEENEKIEEIETSDVNEKLRGKSKSDSFKAAFKKHWRRVAIVVGLVVILIGLKSLNQKDVDKATDSIINDDKTMENVIDSVDPETSLKDFFDKNGLVITDDENTKDNTTEDAKDNVEETSKPSPTSNPAPSESDKETKPSSTENDVAPVKPSTIVDEHPDVTPEHAEPVDPSTIVDEHPDEEIVTPTPDPTATPDQGIVIDEGGVTGDETVPADAWENETPVPSSTTTPIIEDNSGITGNETVPADAWDNEAPIIENPDISSIQTENSVVATATPEIVNTGIVSPTPITNTLTTTIAVNEGDALIVTADGINYVSDNASNYVEKETDQDIFANDAVKSVSVVTDEAGTDTIKVEISSSEAVRDTALTDADVAAISAANDINADEIAQIEAQYKAQQAALEELKQQVQSSDATVVEQTIENTK